MSLLFLDPCSGLAGDMLCGALFDLGADLDLVRSQLTSLDLDGFTVDRVSVSRGYLRATHFRVHLADEVGSPHRGLSTIRTILTQASLPPRALERALSTFQHLAEAEAHVHGVDIEEVHFHEVGAIDAIVDVVTACLALEQLDVERIVCGPLPLGGGTIEATHGSIPLPAPATLELLRGWPIRGNIPDGEWVTPTGAALLKAIAEPGCLPDMRLTATGYGAGTRNPPDQPNVLRALLGEGPSSSPTTVELVETQMDDLPGEHLPPLMEALLAAGALDVFAVPVTMKKGRPGLWVHALCTVDQLDAVETAMLRHGSTFGTRRHRCARRVLDRRHQVVETPWGPIRVKLGTLQGELLHAAPEYEDVASAAKSAGKNVGWMRALALRKLGAVHEEDDGETSP
ncbi:MAG: nickel pincer cofactor biosynthesis protein LarC [Myxococcota bacterium]|nr:nickel pincer cofactor biosynthesis protein LarC [Myxococcota bacterium]